MLYITAASCLNFVIFERKIDGYEKNKYLYPIITTYRNAMQKKFVAFISYSRKDKTIADWLHAKLERYVLPSNIDIKSVFPFEGKYFRPVFLDTQDLHVEERPFTDRIRDGLENASFLIVLCSKNSAQSDFVDKEIRYFLKVHDNNYSRIVPLFIDEVDGSIPPALASTSIMERHFPIFNSRLGKDSEANNYCFYQIISYILNIDFSTIYNRYEIYASHKLRVRKRRYISVIIALVAMLAILAGYHYKFKEMNETALHKKQELIDFEKKVFPAAVVEGYEKNFLSPVISYLKESPEPFCIYILMPKHERDLTHTDRVGDFAYMAKSAYGMDSIPYELLPTKTRRGSRIMRISMNGHLLDGIYLDFATTTTSFLQIAKYKKRNEAYEDVPIDSLINEYSMAFIAETNDRLKEDSVHVKFFLDKKDLLEDLKHRLQ